ncbi:MAG: hypothetical protein K8R40_12480, partial [Anaerolineaceae bacterium]|nr:hypothetical protein [Anaerolineaceae bacterium]
SYLTRRTLRLKGENPMNKKEKLYLVLVEADKIQSYIFQTGKLTENIGASTFIYEYNRDKAYRYLLNTGWHGNIEQVNEKFKISCGKSILSDNLDYELIYSGGGNVKLILKSLEKAKKIAKELVRLYRKCTVSANVTWVVYEFNPNHSFDLVMQEAERQMRQKKLSKEITVQQRTIPHLKLCQSCGKEAAIKRLKEGDPEIYLCHSCFKKRKKGKNADFTQFHSLLSSNLNLIFSSTEFKNKIPSSLFNHNDFLSREFDHLADPRNFIAIVVIDGNRFGKKM